MVIEGSSDLYPIQSLHLVVGGGALADFNGDDFRKSIIQKFEPKLGEKPYGSLNFETVSPFGMDRIVLVDSMLALPGSLGHRLFREGSSDLEYIAYNCANHRALERMYRGPVSESPLEHSWARIFIEGIHNSIAVRNRLRIVEQVFESHMHEVIGSGKGTSQVLSVAAGSSRGMLETLARLNGEGHHKARLRLVDVSPDAISDTKSLSEEMGIADDVDLVQANCFRFNKYLSEGYKADFIEIVGLLDYLKDKAVVQLLSHLREHNLSTEGKIIFSNIQDNDEKEFTHRIVGWTDMYYRSLNDLSRLTEASGFRRHRAMAEPLNIYNIVEATN